jgi:hypothetical protein
MEVDVRRVWLSRLCDFGALWLAPGFDNPLTFRRYDRQFSDCLVARICFEFGKRSFASAQFPRSTKVVCEHVRRWMRKAHGMPQPTQRVLEFPVMHAVLGCARTHARRRR